MRTLGVLASASRVDGVRREQMEVARTAAALRHEENSLSGFRMGRL